MYFHSPIEAGFTSLFGLHFFLQTFSRWPVTKQHVLPLSVSAFVPIQSQIENENEQPFSAKKTKFIIINVLPEVDLED